MPGTVGAGTATNRPSGLPSGLSSGRCDWGRDMLGVNLCSSFYFLSRSDLPVVDFKIRSCLPSGAQSILRRVLVSNHSSAFESYPSLVILLLKVPCFGRHPLSPRRPHQQTFASPRCSLSRLSACQPNFHPACAFISSATSQEPSALGSRIITYRTR